MHAPSLLLLLSLLSGSAFADEEMDAANRFMEHPAFFFCDAELLSRHWGVDTWEAKVRAGRKLENADASVVFPYLEEARSSVAAQGDEGVCHMSWEGFGYDDAELLAQMWGTTVEEAKARAGRKLVWGSGQTLTDEIAYARTELGSGQGGDATGDEQAFAAFLDAGFRYCEAKKLADFWGVEPWEAKVRGGQKVLAVGHAGTLSAALANAADSLSAQHCSLYEADFGHADAALLAAAWNLSGVDEAKSMMEDKVNRGWGPQLRLDLSIMAEDMGMVPDDKAMPAPDPQDLAAFEASDWTSCDATILAVSWQESVELASATIGYKVRSGYEGQVGGLLAGARPVAQAAGMTSCSVEASGFTRQDVVALAAYWRVSPEAAEQRMGEQLFAGQAGLVKHDLAQAGSKRKRRWRLFRRNR